jgi:hypothetical protein
VATSIQALCDDVQRARFAGASKRFQRLSGRDIRLARG